MPERKDFFISYTGADRIWAEWIAWVLEEAGYTTLIQAWDFNAASNFILKMQSGTTDTARTIAVLTPDYFESAFTKPEWAVAFANDPTAENGKLIPVRVADFKPPGLFKAIVYIDLVGLEATAAEEKLTKSVAGIVTGKRLKPDTKPGFPGAKSSTARGARPAFPGTPTGSKTFLHNLPFAPNPFFTGRDQMLDDLHTALQKKTAAAITQPQAVHGLGGVGKTQLAIEYAWRNKADYAAALWATASSSSELHARMAALAAVLSLPEAEATEQEIKVQAVVEWLRSHQRWLLILDNADTKEAQAAVRQLLPPGLPGHVLVTSRIADWPVGYEDLEVSVLPEPAATEFLLKRAHKGGFSPGSESDALAVAKELGCLPLALEQAGAYIARHRVGFAAYLKLLRESRARLLEFPSQGGTGYQRTVATTWLVSEQQLSLTARAILQMAAFLAPDDIPRALFTHDGNVISEAAPSPHPMGRGQGEGTAVEIADALAELADHSLIELEAETFSCHRLLQAALLDRLKKEDRKRWAETTLKLVNEFAPSEPDDVRTWPVWDGLSPHASAILKELWERINPDVSLLMNQLGILLLAKALYAEAEPLQRRALAIDEKSFGPDHPNVAIRLNNVAQLLKATNRLGEAEPLMRRALAINEKSFRPEHPTVAIHLNNLSSLLYATNRLGEAEPLMRRALAIWEKSRGEIHPNVATALNNLAQVLQATNRLGEAEPLMRRALAIDEKSFGSRHPRVALDLNNLARLLQDTNRLGEAETLMRRALAIDAISYDPKHPRVATDLNNLASLLQERNLLGEAETLMRQALRIFNQSLGFEHPNTQIVLGNYKELLEGMKLNQKQIEAKLREVLGG